MEQVSELTTKQATLMKEVSRPVPRKGGWTTYELKALIINDVGVTNWHVSVTVVYSSLRRLMRRGLVVDEWRDVDGVPSQLWRVTTEGRRVARKLKK